MGMVVSARSSKLKMKHFIIPCFKPSFLQPTPLRSGCYLPLTHLSSLLGSPLLPFPPSPSVLLCKSSLQQAVQKSLMSLFTASHSLHIIFLSSPKHWYLTACSHPPLFLQSCDWLFLCTCDTLLSSSVSHTYIFSPQMYLCQDLPECWLCPPALAVPPSMPLPGDLVSVPAWWEPGCERVLSALQNPAHCILAKKLQEQINTICHVNSAVTRLHPGFSKVFLQC